MSIINKFIKAGKCNLPFLSGDGHPPKSEETWGDLNVRQYEKISKRGNETERGIVLYTTQYVLIFTCFRGFLILFLNS